MREPTGNHHAIPPPPHPDDVPTNPGVRRQEGSGWPPNGNGSTKIIGAVLVGLLVASAGALVRDWAGGQVTDQRVEQLEHGKASRERVRQIEQRTVEDRKLLHDVAEDMQSVKGDVRVIRVRIDEWARSVERAR